MPDFDGTGPRGKGPLTGRGRGLCVDGLRQAYRNTSRGVKLMSFVIPAVTTVIMDARNPDGVTRRLLSAVKNKITGSGRKQISKTPINYIEDDKTE